MTARKNGRPASYTDEDIIACIEILEKEGRPVTGDSVKKVMCERLGRSPGINAQSLAKEVERVLEECEIERNAKLIANLTEDSKLSAIAIGQRITKDVTLQLALEFKKLQGTTEKHLIEKDEDLRVQRDQIRGLSTRIEEKDEEIANLERANADLSEQLALVSTEAADLRAQVDKLKGEEEFERRVESTIAAALEKSGLRAA